MNMMASEFKIPDIPDITDAGIVPVRTADPYEALERVRADGAVIFAGLEPTAKGAQGVARTVFDSSVLAVPEAAAVRYAPEHGRRQSPEDALGAHTDGYSYGDHNPDYFLLLCAKDSAVGGESILVDAYKILDEVGSTPQGQELIERLERLTVDQTQDGMHRLISPMIGHTTGGRRRVKRFPRQRVRADSLTPDEDAALIDVWDRLCRSAAASAPRFKLKPGEAVIVDNYRTLHGREPYTDYDRLLWRVWIWTDAGQDIPAGALASDRRFAAVPTAMTGSGWPMIEAETTSLVPEKVTEPAAGAERLARDGAAIVTGIASEEAAVEAARAMLGERAVKVAPRSGITKQGYLASMAKMATTGPDRLGRVRRLSSPDEVMYAHNDGYSYGDYAPDYLFLWCDRADGEGGGASWLVDGLGLLGVLAADEATKELVEFTRTEEIDHSVPGVITPPSPITREMPSGRQQVRHNPYIAPVEGADGEQAPMVSAWSEAVNTARDRATRFFLRPGELFCIDNYRMFHGRDPYTDPARRLFGTWAWTTDAVKVPDGDADPRQSTVAADAM